MLTRRCASVISVRRNILPPGCVYFAGIGEQVGQHLGQAPRIPAYRCRGIGQIDDEFMLAIGDLRPHHFDRVRYDVVQIDGLEVEGDLPLADPRQVEQVIDQTHQMVELALHHCVGASGHGGARAGQLQQVETRPEGRKRASYRAGGVQQRPRRHQRLGGAAIAKLQLKFFIGDDLTAGSPHHRPPIRKHLQPLYARLVRLGLPAPRRFPPMAARGHLLSRRKAQRLGRATLVATG